MLQIRLTRSDVDHRWSVSLVDGQNVFWCSPETFDSPDIAYYRAVGEYILRKWDGNNGHPPRSLVPDKAVLASKSDEHEPAV